MKKFKICRPIFWLTSCEQMCGLMKLLMNIIVNCLLCIVGMAMHDIIYFFIVIIVVVAIDRFMRKRVSAFVWDVY